MAIDTSAYREMTDEQKQYFLPKMATGEICAAVEKGTIKSYRKAVETGHIEASGDSNVLKLIAQVVERQEERSQLRKVH